MDTFLLDVRGRAGGGVVTAAVEESPANGMASATGECGGSERVPGNCGGDCWAGFFLYVRDGAANQSNHECIGE